MSDWSNCPLLALGVNISATKKERNKCIVATAENLTADTMTRGIVNCLMMYWGMKVASST